jgi:hypothetical protein
MKELEKSTLIEDQWKLYTIVAKLHGANISDSALKYMRTAFYAGFTHLLMLIEFEMPKMGVQKGAEALRSMTNQANIFWQMVEGKEDQKN